MSKDVSIRRSLAVSGSDPFQLINRLQDENKSLRSELENLKSNFEATVSRSQELEIEAKEVQRKYSEAKEVLTIAEAANVKNDRLETTKRTLQKLQQVWKELGVDCLDREKDRRDIENCLEDTCDRKLTEANDLYFETNQKILSLSGRLNAMQSALGISPSIIDLKKSGTLFGSLEILNAEVHRLEPEIRDASNRRNMIYEDAVALSNSMGISTSQLTSNLQELIDQGHFSLDLPDHSNESSSNHNSGSGVEDDEQSLPDVARSKETIGGLMGIPEGSVEESRNVEIVIRRLDEEFLSSCENDVTKLRLKKSEILVQNQELQHAASVLAKEMHLNTNDVLELVEKNQSTYSGGLPIWWRNGVANEVSRALLTPGIPPGVTEGHKQHLVLIHDVLAKISRGRRSLSMALRGIVERAQKTLLNIVGRELDASEAYASFHDALFRLPAVSNELINACISEMDALAAGVEAMTQSEIEALSVVWEAMNISPTDRRSFWGEVDVFVTDMGNKVNPFDEAARLCSKDIDGWVHEAVNRAMNGYRLLENRLFKLEKIHEEVEKLRSRQDSKSRILSLDSEVRILNAKLLDFEDLQCSKERLLSKKSGGSSLLIKEERFRKQMQGKFVSKVQQLASLLQTWKKEEKADFDASLLSDDVRLLLSNPDKMETRFELMPLRLTTPARKRHAESSSAGNNEGRLNNRSSRYKSNITPPRMRPSRSARLGKATTKPPQPRTQPSTGGSRVPTPTRLGVKRKQDEKSKVVDKSSKVQRTSDRARRAPPKSRPSAILPFGNVLSELASPSEKENSSRST